MSMHPMPPQGGAAPAPRPGWWSRNWKWVVPMGCLSMVGLIVLFVAGIVLIVFGAMKSSDAYKTAVARAKANPEVVAALGTPIEEGMFVSGKTNVEGSSGEADLTIPISGPKGKAKIYAIATKHAGRWSYSTLTVEIAGREERIDLIGGASADTEDVER
jgi:hypothetical protein